MFTVYIYKTFKYVILLLLFYLLYVYKAMELRLILCLDTQNKTTSLSMQQTKPLQAVTSRTQWKKGSIGIRKIKTNKL